MSIEKLFKVGLAILLAGVAGCGGSRDSDSGLVIAVIPKGTTHEFWKSIEAGARQAQKDLTASGTAVDVIWKGPLRENDREQQIQVVEGFLSQGVDGIVLAPLDDKALVRPVEEAATGGIPTVIIDSDLDSEETISFVATDNFKGGRLAAGRIAELLPDGGNVILLRYQEGSASTRNREEGFLERLKESPNLLLISDDQYAGATRETAKQASENVLNRFGDDVDAIFCPNESSTAGMLLALQDREKNGKVVFVGFDAAMALLDALQAGDLQALVVQNPFQMGRLGVQTMVRHLRGEVVPKRIDTGVSLLTRENLAEYRRTGTLPAQ